MTITRYDFDPTVLQETIEAKVAILEKQKTDRLARGVAFRQIAEGEGREYSFNPESITAIYDELIARERTYYALARVIRRRGRKPYFIVYGDGDDMTSTATGGFSNFNEAKQWFLSQGR